MKGAFILSALILLWPHLARTADLDDALEIILTSQKRVYSLQETLTFKVTTTNKSHTPIKVLVRTYDWTDSSRIQGNDRPRPLGKFEFSKDGSIEALPRVDLNIDIGGCGTGLKMGLMPPGAKGEAIYRISPRQFVATPGVYRFQWRAYRSQGRNKGLLNLSKAVSDVVEIVIKE